MEFSFVVPIYNDAWLAEDFCVEFQRVMRQYLGTTALEGKVELIFVNDGGRPGSWAELTAAVAGFPFAKAIDLSRNFGQHIALSCGYQYAQGAYVGMLNVDMEDPPDQIPVLLDLIRKGEHDIVYGLRGERKSPWLESFTSKAFNLVLNKLTGHDLPLNMATLRVMDRQFVDAYNSLTERSRYLPGLEMWLGFRRGFVPIAHQQRKKGRSSYSFSKRLRMATEAIISFSDLPLRWLVKFGFVVSILGFCLGIYWLVQKLTLPDTAPGFTSTITIIIFFAGMQIIVAGTAGLYIGRVLKESQGRPLFIVRDRSNFDR